MVRRAYHIELILDVPEGVDIMDLDEVVSNVIDASTAREAVADGVHYRNAELEPCQEEWCGHPFADHHHGEKCNTCPCTWYEGLDVAVLNFYMYEAGTEPLLPPSNEEIMQQERDDLYESQIQRFGR